MSPKSAVSFLTTVVLTVSAFAADLPVYDKDEVAYDGDWLVKRPIQQAQVYRNEVGNEIVLSNGLISRTFRITPNAATVGFDNLVTGEAIIRGVKPEALVTIDGVDYSVGGLLGQPNYAFLRPEWIDKLEVDPASLQFVDYEVGEPTERMAWNRVRHHAPNLEWPPKGVSLRMNYRMPDSGALLGPDGLLPSGLGRTTLVDDDFAKLGRSWKVHQSNAHERSSFQNESKVGEIYTPANTAVFVERMLPKDARLVEATFDVGTDRSASWGPGLALVWSNGRTVKFNLRPGGEGSAMIGLWNGSEWIPAAADDQSLDLSQHWTLRMRAEGDTMHCEAMPGDGSWRSVKSIAFPEAWGEPERVRVGKLDLKGGADDFSDEGKLVRLRVLRFAAYSEIDQPAADDAASAMAAAAPDLDAVRVSVHYELYDGIPVLSKWITVENGGNTPITVNRLTSEVLAAVEWGAPVDARNEIVNRPNIHVETDYAFSNFTTEDANHHVVHWEPDPDYSTQVNYLRLTPCLLNVRPSIGPNQVVGAGETFESFRTFVMPYDSYERERKGLALRRMYRVLAPWTTENPLMMHVRFADWDAVKAGIDQCAAVGFEMIILTFGSGFNIEDDSDAYIAKMTQYADYARGKGIEIGGYSLLASRKVSKKDDVVMPEGQRPTFGNSPCLESEWGQDYFRKLYNFYEKTGFMLLEHDGSYPGDPCLSTEHPGHTGYDDSRWNQYKRISDFYAWCRGQGIYLNVPDYYYLAGSNKCGMGYREVNWSLPRAQQVMHTRQNIYDGTWEKTPAMGWMFVPLTEYHGGGAAATIEPLDEHLDHYRAMIQSNLAMGVQACYRGPRLFDTDRTRDMVKSQVDWFKAHRDILESDVVHGRRADGRDLDWMLHVNPDIEEKGMLVVFNPLDEPVQRTLDVNLYYTGLDQTATITAADGLTDKTTLARDYTVDIDVTVPAQGFTWFVIAE